MATLNLSKMKYMSETNLKKFANLIISLSSQVTDVENKCIKPYVGGELYPRDSYVSYNGYIYQATATNQDSAFNETHWDKLSDDFNELTVADIESMLGLSSEQLETMANLIADTEVRLDKTYSSSKIYTDIQQCLNDSKAFTLLELGKFSGVSYKIVASTSEMTSESIIYLLANGNTYDMYIVEENGATTKIGNTDVNLDNYFTKAEIEADYLKKVDADGKYATITTVDGKVNKNDIVDNLTSTDTDKPLSANQGKVLNDTINEMKTNFQDGVNTIYDSVVAKGVTPVDKSPSSIADAISKICIIIKENIPLIPIMTSETTPSGKVSVSSSANSGTIPYYIFDGTDRYWASRTPTNTWIRYDFDEDVCVNKISFKVISEHEGTNEARVKDFRFEISINGHDWVTLYTGTAARDCTNIQTFEFDNKNFYKYYRVYIVNGYSGTVYNSLDYLQFYGYKSL